MCSARHGMTRYCREHSARQGTTLTAQDRAARRAALPDRDTTWSGHPLTRVEAERIRTELRTQLGEICLRWERQSAADRVALNLDSTFRHGT